MSMNTATFGKSVGLALYTKPHKIEADKKVFDWEKVVKDGTMDRATWQTYQFTGFGTANLTTELQKLKYESAFELDPIVFTAIKFTKNFIVSEELEEDNWQLKNLLGVWAKSTGRSQSYAREVAISSMFDNAFDSDYAGWDSVELCGSHTTNSGTTIDNDLGPSGISYDTIWDGIKYFNYQIFDEAGLPVSDTPKILQTHPKNQDVVEEVLDSKLKDADYTINTLKGQSLTPLYNRLLSSTTAFFLHGAMQKDYMHFLQRKAVEVKWKDAFDNMGKKCRSSQRFAYGHSDYRCILGNPGA